MATPKPEQMQEDQHNILPTQSIAIDVSSTDADLTTLLPPYARRLYIGVGGDVTAQMLNGSAVLYKSVPQGTYMDGMWITVKRTGTSATNIVAER